MYLVIMFFVFFSWNCDGSNNCPNNKERPYIKDPSAHNELETLPYPLPSNRTTYERCHRLCRQMRECVAFHITGGGQLGECQLLQNNTSAGTNGCKPSITLCRLPQIMLCCLQYQCQVFAFCHSTVLLRYKLVSTVLSNNA